MSQRGKASAGSRGWVLQAGPSGCSSIRRRSRGPVGVPEGPAHGGWPVGKLDSPRPQPAKLSCPEAWFLRAGGDAETLVRLEGPPTRRHLSHGRIGGTDPSFIPTWARLGLRYHRKTGRSPWSFTYRPVPFSEVEMEVLKSQVK